MGTPVEKQLVWYVCQKPEINSDYLAKIKFTWVYEDGASFII